MARPPDCNELEWSGLCRATRLFLLWEHADITVQSTGWRGSLATHHTGAPVRGLYVAQAPCPPQLAYLHGLGDPVYVLLGFLDPGLQIVQYLPHLLDVLNHICDAKLSNLTLGTLSELYMVGRLLLSVLFYLPHEARHHCCDFSAVKRSYNLPLGW